MSPEDIILNYFFHEPAEKEKKIFDSLYNFSKDHVYSEVEERSDFQMDGTSQKSSFRDPLYTWHKKDY